MHFSLQLPTRKIRRRNLRVGNIPSLQRKKIYPLPPQKNDNEKKQGEAKWSDYSGSLCEKETKIYGTR